MNSFTKLAALAATIALAAQLSHAAENSPASSAANGASQQPLAAPASAAAPSATPSADPAYTYKTLRLNRAAFDALAAKPEQLVVLDIRRPDELVKYGGFPAYLSIQTNDVQKSLAYIPQNRLIVTVSNHAHRAGAIGDILSSYGYHVVGAIGVLDYEAEGGVLTKIPPPPPRTASAAPSNSAAPTSPAESSPSAK